MNTIPLVAVWVNPTFSLTIKIQSFMVVINLLIIIIKFFAAGWI